MNCFKFVLAIALYVTSVSFEEQVLVTDDNIASYWEVSIGTNHAMALKFDY